MRFIPIGILVILTIMFSIRYNHYTRLDEYLKGAMLEEETKHEEFIKWLDELIKSDTSNIELELFLIKGKEINASNAFQKNTKLLYEEFLKPHKVEFYPHESAFVLFRKLVKFLASTQKASKANMEVVVRNQRKRTDGVREIELSVISTIEMSKNVSLYVDGRLIDKPNRDLRTSPDKEIYAAVKNPVSGETKRINISR